MATILTQAAPKQTGAPGPWEDWVEIDYNMASGNGQIGILANTITHWAAVLISTAFTAASSATFATGDSTSANNYMQTGDVTVTSAGMNNSMSKARTNAYGAIYTSADNFIFAFTTNKANDTAGVGLCGGSGFYMGDSSTGAGFSAIQ